MRAPVCAGDDIADFVRRAGRSDGARRDRPPCPGWTLEKANAHLTAISKGIFEATLPEDYDAADAKHYLGFRLYARPAATGFSDLREDYAQPLWLLLGISALVLLIACANIANLMVARAEVPKRGPRCGLPRARRAAGSSASFSPRAFVLAAAGAACGAPLAQALSNPRPS
jgi:hypothetical protein